MTAPPDDFYRVLGVPRTAGQDEIQRAYRRLARQYHPDINKDPGAEEQFKQISEAYDVLSDPETRRRYDRFGPRFRQAAEEGARAGAGAGPGPGAGPGGRTRWGGTRWGGTPWGGPEDAWGGVDLEDLLGEVFGGRGRPGPGWGAVQGADQEAEIVLTVEEAYHGGRRPVTLSGPTGTRSLNVTIPPGVTEGQRIRLAGQGGQGGGGASAGDLFLIVRIAPHPRYRVDGRDLHVDLPLAAWEAALGGSVTVDTPGGEAKVRIPPGTSSGRRLRLRGRGLPNPRGTPGDLYAEVRILVPPAPSAEERRLFQELAAKSTFDVRGQR